MDLQRVFLLLGLAVTSYMLILAWNEDYGQGSAAKPESIAPAVVDESSSNTIPGLSAPSSAAMDGSIPGGVSTDQSIDDDIVPSLAVPAEQAVQTTEANAGREYVSVKTDVLSLLIDPLGGDVVSVALPKYPARLETPNIPFLLIDPANSYVAQSGLIGPSGTDKSGSRPVFQTTRQNFEMGNAEELRVVLTYQQDNGAEIEKIFTFRRGDYLIDVDYRIVNRSSQPWRGAMFTQIKRDSQDPQSSADNLMGMQPYVGGATRSDDEFYKKLEFEDIEEESYRLVRGEGYVAMVEHYFISAWVPRIEGEHTYQARKLKDRDIYLFGFTSPAISVAAGEEQTMGASFYAGPKDQYRLQEIADGLDLTVDYGFLWWLAQPLFYLLTFIHGFVGNWGLAIIGLTIIVKSLLFPLSATSFRSMAKMRKLQPEMAKLKERYGDDRQQFSQAMMELYKKEGANPLGGCFPILLQMPVFLALYWALMESVELRQAPFFFWIKDLSAMDPYFILPILMGISMFLTQMLQPEPPDPIQARVFKMMPIMFTFFFLWFPSGLVLYWLVNNILSILQQWYVTRQIEKESN